MTELRQSLVETMAYVHLIPLDLAAYHVLRMDDAEVEFKFWSYFKVSGPVARVAQGAIGNLTINGMGVSGPEKQASPCR
jgi:hypothetical protein